MICTFYSWPFWDRKCFKPLVVWLCARLCPPLPSPPQVGRDGEAPAAFDLDLSFYHLPYPTRVIFCPLELLLLKSWLLTHPPLRLTLSSYSVSITSRVPQVQESQGQFAKASEEWHILGDYFCMNRSTSCRSLDAVVYQTLDTKCCGCVSHGNTHRKPAKKDLLLSYFPCNNVQRQRGSVSGWGPEVIGQRAGCGFHFRLMLHCLCGLNHYILLLPWKLSSCLIWTCFSVQLTRTGLCGEDAHWDEGQWSRVGPCLIL